MNQLIVIVQIVCCLMIENSSDFFSLLNLPSNVIDFYKELIVLI